MKNHLKKIYKKLLYNFFKKIYGSIHNSISLNEFKDSKTKNIEIDKNKEYKIYSIKNCKIYTDGTHDFAVIKENNIIKEPSYQYRFLKDAYKNSSIKDNCVFERGTPKIKKKYNGIVASMLTGGGGNYNYFHWLFDVLPRLKILNEYTNIENINYFLFPNLKKNFQIETLNLLNIPAKKRISSQESKHFECQEIITTSHPYVFQNNPASEIQNIPIWISQWLQKKFIQKNDLRANFEKKKRVYIDRNDSSNNENKTRKLLNEDEIKDFLKKLGFEIVKLSNLSFLNQVELFKDSEIITGLHGAGFSNIVFCQKKTKILEFQSPGANKVLENIGLSNDLNYEVISREPSEGKIGNQQGSIKIPLEIIKQKLLKLGL